MNLTQPGKLRPNCSTPVIVLAFPTQTIKPTAARHKCSRALRCLLESAVENCRHLSVEGKVLWVGERGYTPRISLKTWALKLANLPKLHQISTESLDESSRVSSWAIGGSLEAQLWLLRLGSELVQSQQEEGSPPGRPGSQNNLLKTNRSRSDDGSALSSLFPHTHTGSFPRGRFVQP